tara:strand:- start:1 stop:1500 length:1500 start_codon:yes stop_codon:yes gene_type:complete
VAEDRNLLERAQDYLVSGDFDRDARYVLGPHLSKGLLGLAQLIGPGADIKAGMDEVKRIVPSLREGNIPGALTATGLAAATPLFMVSPGSAKEVRQVSEEAMSPLRRLFEDLPEETKQALPKQPNETGLFGYHGSSKGRLEEKGKDYFDIKFGNPNDQFMGEGFYFTINPKVAEEYANLRATKDFNPIKKADPSRPGKMKDTGKYINPKTKEKATTASLMKGVDIEGKPLLGGQNISRFNLENIEKPYVIKNNKQRLYAKENIDKLKEEGYDSILFKDFDDRSQQILVFPEHIGKVSGKTTKEAATENISVFPKPERMFPEGQRPKGGEYLNLKTGDVLTNKNVESASISITPEGKPKFDAVPVEKEIVGSPSAKGATQIKTNLFKKSAGWKWIDGPKKYKDIPTLVSVQNKGKHYYTLETNFPEGVNLTRYADSPSEPRLRPTVKGFVNLGKKIGTISVRGKKHPVYDKIINKYAGGQIKKGGSIVERNPNNYSPKAI